MILMKGEKSRSLFHLAGNNVVGVPVHFTPGWSRDFLDGSIVDKKFTRVTFAMVAEAHFLKSV